MSMITIGKTMAVGTALGAGGGTYAATKLGPEDSAGPATLVAGAGAGIVGGQVAGRVAGPQISWFKAVHDLKQSHKRQLQVAADVKSGFVNKLSVPDNAKYMEKSATIFNRAEKSLLSAAVPKKPIVLASAALGAVLLGGGAAELAQRIEN